jgi:hypothetical protein
LTEKHREIERKRLTVTTSVIQEKKLEEGISSKRARTHCHLQTEGFMEEEGPGKW